MDRHCCGVGGDEERCGGYSGSILGSDHHESEVTMDSANQWCEDGCRDAVDIGIAGLDALEGGVHGYLRNGCQVGEKEVRDNGVGGSHGGNNENTAIGSWDVFRQAFLSHTEDRGKRKKFSSVDEIYR